MAGPDWSIHDIARLAGTTSRTLRHYDDVGLVKPSPRFQLQRAVDARAASGTRSQGSV